MKIKNSLTRLKASDSVKINFKQEGQQMNVTQIKLTDIPKILLPVITTTKTATVWLNGLQVKGIYLLPTRYEITTDKGQYRYGLDTDLTLEITS